MTTCTIQNRLAEHFSRIEWADELQRRRVQSADTELRTAQQAFGTYARLELVPIFEQVRDFLLTRDMGAAILDDLEPGPGKMCQICLCFTNAFMPAEKVKLHPQYKITAKMPDLNGVHFEVIGARGKPQARKEGSFALSQLPRGKQVEDMVLRGVTSCIPIPGLG